MRLMDIWKNHCLKTDDIDEISPHTMSGISGDEKPRERFDLVKE